MSDHDPRLLSSYDYILPPERIAHAPVEPRDESRLLVIDRKTGTFTHRHFRDLPEYLDENDLLVANNTRVMKARLIGTRHQTGGKIEMLLLERRTDLEESGYFCWEGAFHSAARQSPGLRFTIPKEDGTFLEGELIRGASESASGTVVARFTEDPLKAGVGELPLPHYIERKNSTASLKAADEHAYQTVYASETGSAAAPTAGLHFTEKTIAQLRKRGTSWEEVTLHVGLGTFRPVKTENIEAHVMHEERYSVTASAAKHMTEHRRAGKRIVCVGTTSVRTLESSYDAEKREFTPGSRGTSIFIYPGGREIHAVDRLITNFHLPKSTLLMLVSAFAGRELVLRAYEEAVCEKYRFFSYGDAMLIL